MQAIQNFGNYIVNNPQVKRVVTLVVVALALGIIMALAASLMGAPLLTAFAVGGLTILASALAIFMLAPLFPVPAAAPLIPGAAV